MNTKESSRARKDATIEVEVCTQCFVSVPAEQIGSHERWHESQQAKQAVNR
jgi:hypothetical protein